MFWNSRMTMKSQESKDGILELYSTLFQVLDGLWFVTLEEEIGYEKTLEIDVKVWETYGRKEAKRLASYFGFDETDPIRSLIFLLKKAPYMPHMEFEFHDISLESTTLLIKKCKTLEAMEKAGRKFVCDQISRIYYKSFAKGLGQDIELEAEFIPVLGEPRPDGISCKWKFYLNKKPE